MYAGRIVVVGVREDYSFGGYRVSSRSFPGRVAQVMDGSVFILPKNARDMLKNPYIAYPCIRTGRDFAVVSNGSHTDVIFDKMVEGYPPRDAIATALLSMDYEKDEYSTPRIAGVVLRDEVYLGFVGRYRLRVEKFTEGSHHVATYGVTDFREIEIHGENAMDIAREMYRLEYEHPICSAGVTVGDRVEIARYNP